MIEINLRPKLIHGDCLEQLKSIPDNSIDSIVTDPPYGISFMGKKWDYDVPSVDVWKECLRVLKPGGHALIACGTRTQHRMAVNIEDAGFEIRDVITWLYGSGFPKSMDISKAIDKQAGAEREVISEKKKVQSYGHEGNNCFGGDIDREGKMLITTPSTKETKQWQGWGTALKPATEHMTLARKNGIELTIFKEASEILCQYLSHVIIAESNSALNQRESEEAANTAQWIAESSINTLDVLYEQMVTLQSILTGSTFSNIVNLWKSILDESSKNMSTFTTLMASSLTIELKILKSYLSRIMQSNTQDQKIQQNGLLLNAPIVENLLASALTKLNSILSIDVQYDVLNDTGSLTDKLNAACEFWTLARKPLSEKTVASNVLKHGTGGLNIDGCRVEASNISDDLFRSRKGGFSSESDIYSNDEKYAIQTTPPQGRWPANLILDEEAAKALDKQSGNLKSGKFNQASKKAENSIYGKHDSYKNPKQFEASEGGASRFFYVAKASKSERNAGCESLPVKRGGTERMNNSDGRKEELGESDRLTLNQNNHPTVKPIKLMSYLCKLITPPRGIVLDPFMGSGSTGVAAAKEGFGFIGIEREESYIEIAKARINVQG
jgi:DNA modification methylase